MDFRGLATKAEGAIEKGLEAAKETLENVARHLPFANLAKHSDNAYEIEIDLPGVAKEDIDIKIEDDRLTVSAVRRFKNEVTEEDYYTCESNFGMISRSFFLGDDIDRDKIEAKYENGRLYLAFEKQEAKKAKNITIQ